MDVLENTKSPAYQRDSFSEKIKSWQRPTLPRESAVPSALESLTAVFGMGTGVSSPPLLPGNLNPYSFLKVLLESLKTAHSGFL